MGRLFWKILLTFWMTLLITALLVGGGFWLLHQAPPPHTHSSASKDMHAMPPAEFRGKPPRRQHIDPLWLLVSAGLLLSFISSFLLAWYFVKPVRSLHNAFHALAQGNLGERVSASIGSRRDEIADLGRDFDHMASQLQNLMASQRRLLHDVSHELRSPLARLQASVGLARQRPERVADSLDRIEQETARLDKLVGEVLTLSRLEAGVPHTTDEYLDVLELLDTVLDAARFEASTLNREVHFESHGSGNTVIQGHGELLYRALENVVRNAIYHTPPDSAVALTATVDTADALLHIVVDDQGSGVPDAELGLIFEPFRRSSLTRINGNGYGLGLAIARRAIESHGGTIKASNRPQGGLRIKIVLPLQTDPANPNITAG